MMRDFKIVQDPLNGPIKISGVVGDLIDDHYFQRLRYIKSLGLCYLVFPGANHTRFEHSIGAMHLARQFAETLNLPDSELAAVSALLHDIGHPPMSHSVEGFFREKSGMDHQTAGVRMVLGRKPFEDSIIPEILENYSIDPKTVSEIMVGKSKEYPLLSRIISGPIDVDELDYLRRDSMFCGVAIGLIDHRRIMNISVVEENEIMIEEKGIPAVESLLISRILMYNSVYFHKTCRISQKMLEYALYSFDQEFTENPFRMGDHDLLSMLKQDRSAGKFIDDIMQRHLYKRVLKKEYSRDAIKDIEGLIKSDPEISSFDYILDVLPPLEFTGTDRVKTDLLVYKDGEKRTLESVSPLSKALYDTLENRSIILSTSREKRERIADLVKGV